MKGSISWFSIFVISTLDIINVQDNRDIRLIEVRNTKVYIYMYTQMYQMYTCTSSIMITKSMNSYTSDKAYIRE